MPPAVREEMRSQADIIDIENADPNLKIPSHCNGHLWTCDVVGELMSPRGNSAVMQLYNEWSHRIVLLRNALMPFENWDEVPIVIAADSELALQGLRMLEKPTDAFIMPLISVLTASGLPSGGFGFQYSQGTVLPAFMGGSLSSSLLRYYPVREANSMSEVLYSYEYTSYESAKRSVLPPNTTKSASDTVQSKGVACVLKSHTIPNLNSSQAHLKVEVDFRCRPKTVFSVCQGQIARGRRYVNDVPKSEPSQASNLGNIIFHVVKDAHSLPGLVFSVSEPELEQSTLHVFSITEPLLGLALFGKLYPGNIVSLNRTNVLASALRADRGFGTKFVLWQRV
ncbi:hypothetical protein P153DRAFT_390370 [Dothidotthia symphoricarpi CBS 119687]|uniref:Uncharacterized protein n=1 Tax=Dothidotthia symphoricarpi CBS 119687 TaxID=1392245 RepID=A0A6A5ZZ81_9PLEO|nr:uncharacterized protein P153DRAFT_390370 [Dothidotthia symphoricarpi CBS 119687]KAF2124335.1 hypothetical protein P153DRAFT_390370 [Dothidotthia symphoricarpi CBS 119687]